MTEKNYIQGLKSELKKDQVNRMRIDFYVKDNPGKCLEYAQALKRQEPEASIWLLFDRDRVPAFDGILEAASKADVSVAWSNPCIEIWFSAYFGEMRYASSSTECIHEFSQLFAARTGGKKYEKNSGTIYADLVTFGDEQTAISCAKKKYEEIRQSGNECPSQMCPASSVYLLISSLRSP